MHPACKKEIREAAIVSIVLLVFLQVVLFISHADSDSILRDPDAYSWLNRVMLLHNGGDWFDFSNPRINPPVGLEQHWSHLFDLILYSGAWIGSCFIPFETALFNWAVILSPVLQIISLLSLFWALRPIMKDIDYLVLGFLFITQMGHSLYLWNWKTRPPITTELDFYIINRHINPAASLSIPVAILSWRWAYFCLRHVGKCRDSSCCTY